MQTPICKSRRLSLPVKKRLGIAGRSCVIGLVLAFGMAERAHAQAHTFGIVFHKTCPLFSQLGDEVTCNFTLENSDDMHAVIIGLDGNLTDQVPFGVPEFPNGPVVTITTCVDHNSVPLGPPPFQLAASDGVPGSGTDFASCDVTYTLSTDEALCDVLWIDQGVVTFQDVAFPQLTDTDEASGLTIVECFCGDGEITGDETCDGANDEGCQQDCRPPGDPDECTCCGDGDLQGDETCDGDNADACNSACRDDCTCCGDGIVNGDEACDDGNNENCDGCNAECAIEVCGNGVLECDEACDDGNNENCDGCNAECAIEVCGNGVLECDEACDDGNNENCDGCNAECAVEECGNGVLECDEACDDGNNENCDGCNAECAIEECGNGVLECDEACDDGNNENCDGCNAECAIEVCGNGVLECDEACDDGNNENCDGCNAECAVEECGNGVLECDEECDGEDAEACEEECRPDCTCRVGGQGCTPGYWKLVDRDSGKASHECNWVNPYVPDLLFEDACASCADQTVCFDDAFGDMTLLEVLGQGGGGRAALGRHTVAALLNAGSGDVEYLFAACEVITLFNSVSSCEGEECNEVKNIFAAQNEGVFGVSCCPLGVCKCTDNGNHCDVTSKQPCPGGGACEGVDDSGCGDGSSWRFAPGDP